MFYEKPLPFYLTHPLPAGAFTEQLEERDRELLKSYYPETAARIQSLVERECDRMDYEGSMMYDEYPDKLMMHRICRRICDQFLSEMQEPDMEAEERRRRRRWDDRERRDDLEDLVGVLLSHEIFRRRCRHKRCRNFF